MAAARTVSHTDAAIPPAKRISVAETGTHRERLARERWEDGSRPAAPANRFVAPDAKRRQLIFDSFTKLKLQQGAPPPPAGFAQDRGHEQKRADQQAAMDAAHGPKGTLLYTWGAGYHGQLGLATNRKKCRVEPAWIDFKEPVLQVACGGFHTAVLTDQGRMFTWGDGRMGQLGNLARKHNMMSTPHLVDFFTTNKIAIKHISCGQYHTAAVSSLGTMYTWGSAKFNQLGHGTRLDERYPRQVMVDKESVGKFLMASCGDRHTAAVSESRHVYTWGSGPHGQLGHGNGIDCQHPTRVQALDTVSIKTLSCGSTTTAAVAETGELYLWGFGENIHPKDSPNIIETPRLVAMPESVKQVAVGQSHVLALTDSGDVYAFGNGSMMQLGHGAKTNVRAPRLVLRGKNIHEVAAGRYHSMAVAGSGVLYTWGCGESGQLAHGTLDGEALPRLVLPLLANVVGQIACGEHHSFALASIEHSTIHPDIIQWKRIEDEELKLKREMVRDYPAGLSTRQVLDVEKKRDEIANRIEEEMRREQDNEGKHLKEQVGSIRTRDDLLVEVVDDMFEYDDDEGGEPLALEHKRTYVLSPGRAAREASAAAGGDGEPSNDDTTTDGAQPSMTASASLPALGTREMPAPQASGSESAADVLAFFASMEATQKKPLPKPATLAPLPPRHSSAGGHMTSHGGASAPMMLGSPMEPPSGLSIRADAQGDGVSPLQSPMPDPGAGLGVVPPTLTPSPHPAKKKGGLRVQNFHSLSSPSLALRQGAARPLTSLDVRRGGALTVPGQDADLTSDAGSSMPGTTTASLINSQGGYMRGSASGASLQGRSGAASAKPARLRGLSTALVLGTGKASSRSMASLDSTTGEPRQRASTSLDTALALSAEPPPFQPMQPRLAFIEKASVALKKIKTSLQGEQKEQHPSQVIKSLFQKKKDYNALKAKCKEMKADYEGLKLRVSMEKPTTLDDANTFNAQEERIRELRMKLVTLNTRLMEAEENKRNYELYIIRMKEEDLQLSKQIDHVRGLVQEYERLLAKMDRINGRVIGQKGDIDVEIVRFHREIREFSDFAGEQLDKYHRLLKQSSHTISVAEKAVATRGFQLDEKQRVSMEKLTLVAEGNAEEERDIKEELSSWQDKVAYYEKRFHKITAATGLARPEDIVNKFFFNDEITRDLQADINAKKATLARLKETKENCGKELEEEKGQFTTTKWKDVDHLSSNVRNQSKKTVRERTDLDRLLEKLAFVQEGVVSLLGTVESKIGDPSQQQLAATIAVGSGSSAASSLTIPRSATTTSSSGVFPTSSPTSPRHIADVELAAQPIILTPQGGGSLTDVSGGRSADLRIQVEVDPPVAKLETRLQALMVLIESAKRDLSLRESAESEHRRRADDERKAHELQQSVLLKMAAERTMAGVASFG